MTPQQYVSREISQFALNVNIETILILTTFFREASTELYAISFAKTKKEYLKLGIKLSIHAGMIYYMNIEPIRTLILSEKNQVDSYYGLFKKIGPSIKGWK